MKDHIACTDASQDFDLKPEIISDRKLVYLKFIQKRT